MVTLHIRDSMSSQAIYFSLALEKRMEVKDSSFSKMNSFTTLPPRKGCSDFTNHLQNAHFITYTIAMLCKQILLCDQVVLGA